MTTSVDPERPESPTPEEIDPAAFAHDGESIIMEQRRNRARERAGSPTKPTPDSASEGHTNVPAPLAGPARRTALALGVPSLGLAELLMHANFGWAGVAAFTAATAVGAGVVYAVRRRQRDRKSKEGSKVGASKTPSSRASRLRGKSTDDPAVRSGRGRARGGLVSRLTGRSGGRGAAGGAFGRGGSLGGRTRGTAGRSGARLGLGGTGRTGVHGARGRKSLTSPGPRAAAAKAAQLAGGRPSKTSAGLRRLASGSAHHKTGSQTGRSGSASRLGGGSFFGSRGTRPSTTRGSRSRHGGRPHSSIGERGGHGGVAAPSQMRRRHSALRRPRVRRVYRLAAKFGRYAVVPLSVPALLTGAVFAGAAFTVAGLAIGATYGAYRLASSPRVRYGASVIAGWMHLGLSRAYQWARAQWWKTQGRTAAPEVFVAEGETVDEPYEPTRPQASSAARDADVIDAEVVSDTAPSEPTSSGPPPAPPELPAAARQPKLAHTTPASAGTASLQHQEISIVSALNDIAGSITFIPAFTPTSGHDAEQYMDSIVTLLTALGNRVSSDLLAIAEHLPQEAAALGTLNSLGEVLGAFASQAGEQVEAWKQTASWVWKQG